MERTGTAKTRAPSKKRKKGVYDERRIVLSRLGASEVKGVTKPVLMYGSVPVRSVRSSHAVRVGNYLHRCRT